MEQKFVRRSPRFSSNHVANEIGCSISSSKKISSRKLKSPKKDSFDELTAHGAEMNSSKKVDTEELSFSKQEEINEAILSSLLRTSKLTGGFCLKIEDELSPCSLCRNHEEEPKLFSGNSHFIAEKHLRRSPRLSADSKCDCNVDYCSGFDTKIQKPLSRSPRPSLSSCENEQSKPLDNQTSKFARGTKASETRHSSSELLESGTGHPLEKTNNSSGAEKKNNVSKMASFFVGDPVPADEAQQRWKWRYEMKVIVCLCTIYTLPTGRTHISFLELEI